MIETELLQTSVKSVRPLKLVELILLFGIPTLLNVVACRVAIPYLSSNSQLPIEIDYFICVGCIVLVPMFLGAFYLTGREIGSYKFPLIAARMRIKKLTLTDWLWTIPAFVLLSLLSFLIAAVLMPMFKLDPSPFFFKDMPLDRHHFWILYTWPLFFFFNIFGEELLWRGYILPRQELLTKNWTFIIHGVLWAIWHLPMGINLVIASLPILFILPAIVQIRQNTTIAIVVHSVFGGFGFLMLSLGIH